MAPSDPCVFFYLSMFLLQWQCSWDHCHTQKLNHCQSDTIQMVLHVEQNLMLLFCVYNYISFDNIPSNIGKNRAPNHDRAR